MGLKPRKKPGVLSSCPSPCGVVRGKLTGWEHCECYRCTLRQMKVLEKQLSEARKIEGIR